VRSILNDLQAVLFY